MIKSIIHLYSKDFVEDKLLNIFRYACKQPGKSILVRNGDSKEQEVVDSMKLKCNNDRSWNITDETKINACVCEYIQKL